MTQLAKLQLKVWIKMVTELTVFISSFELGNQ